MNSRYCSVMSWRSTFPRPRHRHGAREMSFRFPILGSHKNMIMELWLNESELVAGSEDRLPIRILYML